ncbi:MAG TPA: hypothetical protein GXX43_06455 [Tepidanaerobacter syntrophicus]|uniref:hypothetical protein n=1 Tax=Tepidanaerobacter syntrophicus TaxID=224999 RepID=UPI00176F1CF1|nr:hypothetical protein [Tepidanaerobacter syntrophicus]HHV83285.1 hypothetical protein [Tepidanaerobacter syntrophicus]
MVDNQVIVFVDKTYVRITGIQIKGLKPFELEQTLKNTLQRPIRVIGVTGSAIEMDIYGIEPEAVYKDEKGIIKAISTVSGITAADVIKIAQAERSVEVSVEKFPKGKYSGCARERWLNFDK